MLLLNGLGVARMLVIAEEEDVRDLAGVFRDGAVSLLYELLL